MTSRPRSQINSKSSTATMVAASNSCIPPTAPVTAQVPSLPNTTRGERCQLDGESGRLNSGKSMLAYPSGKLVVIRSLKEEETLPNSKHPVLVYRGHQYATSACKISTSGAYVASGDSRGKLRVWALDHEEHLAKLESQALSSAIRDISWDGESKRIAYAGERLDNSSMCTAAIQVRKITFVSTCSKGTVFISQNSSFKTLSVGYWCDPGKSIPASQG